MNNQQAVNDTKDLDRKQKLLYKFNTVNYQPEVHKTTQKQEKLLNSKANNDSLKTNNELQKQTKNLQIENVLIGAMNGIINETKNEEETMNGNDLQNINDDL